jgi:hypothetical protein
VELLALKRAVVVSVDWLIGSEFTCVFETTVVSATDGDPGGTAGP